MAKRLPPREGEWIDRERPLEFRFEGRTYQGFAGDVVSSALWANGLLIQGRSFKYHRPRGPVSLCGHDANVIVEDGMRTNLRGDLLPLAEGMDLRAVNTVGGLWKDKLRWTERFSKFLPVGFYYKAFHTPRRLFPFYENQMRKVAGLGEINRGAEFASTPKDYAFCDLLVVGAGPSGLAGAIAAAEQGLRVLLVDENPRLGGSFNWQLAGDPDARRQLQELLARVEELENLEVRLGTQAAGYYADHWVALVDDRHLTKVRAGAMLAATGCIEQPAVFGNNDLPGVMLGSAAQRLVHQFAVKPVENALVFTANSDGYRVALDLHAANVSVGIVDTRPDADPTELLTQVDEQGIQVLKGSVVPVATHTRGKKGIKGCFTWLGATDESKQFAKFWPGNRNGIVMSVGWVPNAGLLYQAGVRFRYAAHVEQFVPETLPEGVFAAGRVNGVFELSDRIADGRRGGLAAAKLLGRYEPELPPAPRHDSAPPSHPYPVFVHPKKSHPANKEKAFVDFDEDLQLKDIVDAHQEGYDNIELLKRYSTAGMGPSQGKLANMNAVRILAKLNGKSIDETGTTTSRPFYQPVPLGHLAGRRFHPLRRTPLHDWHVGAGAEVFHAGSWLRPEYYRAEGQSRDDCIFTEAGNVRERAGLIDVSTLGKLRICGPDAVPFLERVYTGRFAKQPVGKLRYGLACDETGVIIEDGVIARLAEDQFYVTATSSGAAAFYRELQRWTLIWGMDVTLINETGHHAAMNLAGPESRAILQPLTDVDLSAEEFPYLGVCEGTVAGVSAKLLRVGFVGEWGYEIHVPASYGLHVWEAIISAGADAGIRPFGVEAQRLLRLEKGHLIVGQDTDALTNPYEAAAAWAIGKNKPFFVGGRSLEIEQQKTLTRRLVGLTFADPEGGPLPEECRLIIHEGEIVGRITSMARRSTLGHPLALAFLRPDLTEAGTTVRVRIDGGVMVEATVAALPFYDPDNQRQQEQPEHA